ncbi:MAG: hypothetical protein WBA76_07545 [Phormidesmis sp.]
MKRVIRLFPQRRQAAKSEQVPKSYARSLQGQAIIRLRLSSPAALLMPFESFPLSFGSTSDYNLNPDLGRDLSKDLTDKHQGEQPPPVLNLNKDLVEYLFARIGELGDESLLLRVTLPTVPAKELPAQPTADLPAQLLHSAIQRYFSYLEDVRRQSLAKLAWDAALFGILGAGALGLSVFLDAQNATAEVGIGMLLLGQGITVFGWLTLWEALANALWNWRPLYQQLRMCQRLQTAQLELAADVAADVSVDISGADT